MRRHALVAIALTCCLGCPVGVPTAGGGKATPRPRASAAATPKAKATTGVRLPLDAAPRLLGPDAVAVSLTGKVKLLSDHGGGIVSNNSGGLISNNGGGLISNNGGGLISDGGGSLVSNNGGGLTGKAKRQLLATGRPESLLADAEIEFLDAAGRVVVGADGKPILARTDATGAFTFQGKLPPEGLVARVRLWNGGVLQAMLPKGSGGDAFDLDTATTLGASYVLARFVKGDPAVYARLPGREAEALRAELEAARGLLGDAVPDYRPQTLVAAAEDLGRRDATVGRRYETIKAILLVGQADLGEGQPADRVALSAPLAITGDAAGNLYVAEFAGGRVRRVGPDGRLYRWAGGTVDSARREGPVGELMIDGPVALATGADGTIYISDAASSVVYAVKAGQARVLAGTGTRAHGALEVPGPSTTLEEPTGLVAAPDGTVYVSDQGQDSKPGRLMAIGVDGVIRGLPAPTEGAKQKLVALAIGPDGATFGLSLQSRTLWRRPPGGAWAVLAADLEVNDHSHVVALADGAVIVSEQLAGRLTRIAPDGTRTPIAGASGPGYTGDGGPSRDARLAQPTGMWLAPDGTLYVADTGNGLVRAIAPPLDGGGAIRTVAGARGVSQQGDALSISINTPGGMAFDRQGRLVFTEGGSSTVKRLEGGQLSLVAGTAQGFGGDGGPATAAAFFIPTGLAYVGDDLYVLESEGLRIRKIDAAGTVTTVAGTGRRGITGGERVLATELLMRRPVACAAGPDGLLYWVDNENGQVLRLTQDGFAEVVVNAAGEEGADGDGGPARDATLFRPLGLAFDARGDMYVADAGNLRIRRVTGLSGPEPRIEAFAGVSIGEALSRADQPAPAGPVPADQAIMFAPTALAFDPAGDLFVAEAGTLRLPALLGSAGVAALFGALPRKGARLCRITGIAAGRPMAQVVAGEGTGTLATPGTDDSLLLPGGLLVDPARGLYVMDTGNNAIKLVPKGAF